RKYIRLDTVMPVQFRILSPDGSYFLSEWQQGFSNNIGKNGLCLTVNNLSGPLAAIIKAERVKLLIEVENPLTKFSMSVRTSVRWTKEIPNKEHNRYLIGLHYERIDQAFNKRLMRYVWLKKLFVPTAVLAVIIMGLAFAIDSYINVRLIRGNKALVEHLVGILQESVIAKQKIKDINRDKENLQLKMQTLEIRIQSLAEEKKKLEEGAKLEEFLNTKKIDEMKTKIEQLSREKDPLQEQLIKLQHKESAVTEQLLQLDEKKAVIEKANFDKMYKWLTIHQNPRTGLVMSFEGDSDISNWGFIYDQSLVAQAYTYFSDFERAKKILDFFAKRAKRRDGMFFNAYYVSDGSPVEYIIHSGPNIWLGIALLHYTKKAQDTRYLRLAEEIAQAIGALQDRENCEGAICGGPNTSWFSTEHNLDAYAFFNMLYEITGKKIYMERRDKILDWLLKYIYAKPDIPIMRGKGDATIATDTYAWSIASIGPKKLAESGMDPDKILEFAEQNCAVEVEYLRPEGNIIKVKGFDFAAQRHLARGGVVSTEWTAQMVLSFKIMAEYYHKKDMESKARTYENKADEYLAQLGSMVISSPSPSGQGEGCLPYASSDSVDTGHGWATPKGNATGSVSGTVYTLFSYYSYNPLELKE
ncbi:MAG: hypothetical protein PHN57_02810, partial [Candidatus Omnitrophica bacterium]|nr:hypothetical protein [Candidatus Omnitrophota bacterium]